MMKLLLRPVYYWVIPMALVATLAASSDVRLADAVKSHDIEYARVLLAQPLDVNAPQGDGSTALHWAVHFGDSDLVDRLIHAGANVNSTTDLGATPLYLACLNADGAMVEELLQSGAKARSALSTGETSLMTCARTGNAEAVAAIIKHGADVNATERSHGQSALMWAVSEQHVDAVRILIENGADVHARSLSHRALVARRMPHAGEQRGHNSGEWVIKGGSTPLLLAARSGNVDIAGLLLAGRADVNEAAPDGNTPLSIAAHSKHGELAAFLLDKGADPDVSGPGYTPLHSAVLRSDPNLIVALIKHGANPDARLTNGAPFRRTDPDYLLLGDLEGATPFLLAARFLEPELMELLAKDGADTKLPMNDGTNPLMAAAGVAWDDAYERRGPYITGATLPTDEQQALATVKMAIQLGADVTAVNRDGDTALHGAVAKGYGEIVQLLVKAGAKLDARNKKGQTPLAIARGNSPFGSLKPVADLLVKLGASE
jgi:ankyrin repeat protein